MTSLHPVKVHIKNFQSIEDLEFEVRGFTCITGKTNIGKSAIMRALSRSLLNDPVTGMVRKGAKFASVEMSSDGWGFTWEKGEKDVNRYVLPTKTLDKTGQTQPKEIKEMGFTSVEIGDDEIEPWWAPQVAPMFLLNKSGPQITDFISGVSRLQVYQNAIVLAARQKRRCTDESRLKTEELGKVQDKLNKLSGLDSVERIESEIEDQIRSLQEYIQKALTLKEIHTHLERIADFLRRTKDASEVKIRADVEVVEEAVTKFVRLARLHMRLEQTAKKIISLKAVDTIKVPSIEIPEVAKLVALRPHLKLVSIRSFLGKVDTVKNVKTPDHQAAETSLGKLKKLHGHAANIRRCQSAVQKLESLPKAPAVVEDDLSKLRKLVVANKRILELRTEIEAADAEIVTLQTKKKELEKKIAELRVCPECGQRLPDEHHTNTKRRRVASA